ncbi:MAG: biotin transporter BioY, partial [Elusimicrobiota bacterium]|nr:biotin transporter BioY [Elusimicrobiota bacterium]
MKNANKNVFIALFASLIAASGFIAIGTGAFIVPIVLQNMMVLLAAGFLGWRGALAVLVFIVGGALGLPVFAGGRGGIGVLFATGGGYIVGYFFASLFVGSILGMPKPLEKNVPISLLKIALALFFGFIIIYIFGVLRLSQIIMKAQNLPFLESLKAAIIAGVIPYLLGDLIKLILGVFLIRKFRPQVCRYL